MSDDRSGDDQASVSSGGGEQPGSGGQQNEQELATKTLHIQHKRFYLDVKQNNRGRFIKVAEVGTAGRKSRLLLSMSAAKEFRDHLSSFSELYASLGPPNVDNFPEDGRIKSEIIVKDNRRYFLDLKENNRGRFLRVSQAFSQGGSRSQIAIPAQGMIEFRDALTDLLEEFGTDDASSVANDGMRETLPQGTNFRVENKKFYFDIGQNKIGVFMRISEVKSTTRSSITIPERSWSRFRDIFADYVEKMNPTNSSTSGSATATSTTAAASGSAGTTGGEQTSTTTGSSEPAKSSTKSTTSTTGGAASTTTPTATSTQEASRNGNSNKK